MLHIVFQRVSCRDLIKRGGGLYVLQCLVYVDFVASLGSSAVRRNVSFYITLFLLLTL